MDAVTGSEEMSKWEGAELTKSDRPDLSSAKIVVSGGTYISNFSFTHIHNQIYLSIQIIIQIDFEFYKIISNQKLFIK